MNKTDIVTVTVHHQTKPFDANTEYEWVATFAFNGEYSDVDDVLEHAWRYTNNVVDSWSGDSAYKDVSKNRVAVKPRGDYGHRLVGDLFIATTNEGKSTSYKVDDFGFEIVEK